MCAGISAVCEDLGASMPWEGEQVNRPASSGQPPIAKPNTLPSEEPLCRPTAISNTLHKLTSAQEEHIFDHFRRGEEEEEWVEPGWGSEEEESDYVYL